MFILGALYVFVSYVKGEHTPMKELQTTVIAAGLLGMAFSSSVQGQEIQSSPLMPTFTLPPPRPASLEEARPEGRWPAGKQWVRNLLETVEPSRKEIVEDTGITAYSYKVPNGSYAIVLEDSLTGKTCVQPHAYMNSGAPAAPYECYDLGPLTMADFTGRTIQAPPKNPEPRREKYSGGGMEEADLNIGISASELKIVHTWNTNAEKPEVCTTIIQQYPEVSITEAGCNKPDPWIYVGKFLAGKGQMDF